MKGTKNLVCYTLAALLLGCTGDNTTINGGSTVGSVGTGQKGLAGRLFLTKRLVLTSADYTTVKTQGKAQLEAQGFTFDDATHSLTAPAQALGSMFVRNGTKLLGYTDSTGLVRMASMPVGVTTVQVSNNLNDKALASFSPSQLGGLDSPSTVRMMFDVNGEDLLTLMDQKTRLEPQICGTDCGHTNQCCLDYDGYSSVSVKPCGIADKLIHFPGSTCYKWWSLGVCADDNRLGGDEGRCFQNHKGRWCQQIDDTDFSATPDKTSISVGQTVTITVHNNTRKNEITAELQSNIGSLETPTPLGPGTGQMVTIKHWTGTDPTFTWFPDRTLLYHAPATLPNGQKQATVVVRVYGQSGPVDITITIC